MRTLTSLLLLLVVVFLFERGGSGKPTPSDSPAAQALQARPPDRCLAVHDEAKLIQEILAAEKPTQAAEGFGTLFKLASADDVRRLQRNASDTIAVQLATRAIPVMHVSAVYVSTEDKTRALGEEPQSVPVQD